MSSLPSSLKIITSAPQLPEINSHGRIKEFLPGGVQALLPENSFDIFCLVFFTQLILQFYIGLLERKLSFSKVSEGVHLFPGGGVQLFPEGSKC